MEKMELNLRAYLINAAAGRVTPCMPPYGLKRLAFLENRTLRRARSDAPCHYEMASDVFTGKFDLQ